MTLLVLGSAMREHVIKAQRIAGKLLVFKAQLPAPNSDGNYFFTARSVTDARKRADELGLVGGVRRATHQELLTIAIRALDDL